MKMMFIQIVIGATGTVTKGLIKRLVDLEIRGRVETIQITTLLRSARIFRRVLEIWGDLLSLKLKWKTIRVSWCENFLGANNNKNNNFFRPVIQFQVLVSNTINFKTDVADLYIKPACSIILSQSGNGINDNEKVIIRLFVTPPNQGFRTEATSLEAS